jgi:hypothetical protein
MKIKLLMVSSCVLVSFGISGLVAQDQKSPSGRAMCMWDISRDQCMRMMKNSGMGQGMMMRWLMMGALQVDSYDPAALLAIKTELSLTTEQQDKLAAIQSEAREKAKAILTVTQQNQIKPLLTTPNTMTGMCQQWHAKMNNQTISGSCCW